MKRLIILLLLFIPSILLSETIIRYDNKICKMEILSSGDIKNRNSKEIIKNDVLKFCKDKYIYNINMTVDRSNNHIYIIFYNDKILD